MTGSGEKCTKIIHTLGRMKISYLSKCLVEDHVS